MSSKASIFRRSTNQPAIPNRSACAKSKVPSIGKVNVVAFVVGRAQQFAEQIIESEIRTGQAPVFVLLPYANRGGRR